MNDPFLRFLSVARWTSAIVATMYHVRFLLLSSYGSLHDPSPLLTGFYFLTGLGHESYAVYFIVDGICAGLRLQRQRATGAAASAAVLRHLGALYLVFLPGLLVGACFDLAGARLPGHEAVYAAFPAFSTLTLTYPAFLGNLLMLQPFAVPAFGSNSMLYLPSWLFWCAILLALYLRAGAAPRGRSLRLLLVLVALALLPYPFLIWAAIWLVSVGLVFVSESRQWRPPLLAGLALCAGALVVSRLLGPLSASVPPPARDVIVQCGFLLVGLGFATIAWARYPTRRASEAHGLPVATTAGWRERTASFTFFFHFPVIMLLATLGATRLGLPLMQPPSATALAWFACLVAASAVVATLATTITTRIVRACTDLASLQAVKRR